MDSEKFREDLRIAFVKLLDSKRGVASDLARAIDKKPYYVGGPKRGKPVNALHLKAVEIVFGPKKVLELLSANESIDTNQYTWRKQETHKEISTNELLNEIEELDIKAYYEVIGFIKGVHSQIKKKTNKKIDLEPELEKI